MDTALFSLSTLEYQAPQLVYSGIEVYDYGDGTQAIIEDSQIQLGEQVKLKIFVQNIGQNIAKKIKYKVYSKDPDLYIVDNANNIVESTQGTIDDLPIGESNYFWVNVSPNKRLDPRGKLPIYLDLMVDRDRGDLLAFNMPIFPNQKPPAIKELNVTADIEKFLSQKSEIFAGTSKKLQVRQSNLINIHEVQRSKTIRPDAVGLIFGVEKYNTIPPAPFAENDAAIIQDYFKERLGIHNTVMYNSKDVVGFKFNNVFNSNTGELQAAIEKGKTDIFIFYSGHGIPSKDGSQVYLLPADGNINNIEEQGYNLNELFTNLEMMGARSITIFMDACFSGTSRYSNNNPQQNLTGQKGVYIKPRISKPWEKNTNFSVLSSSTYNETSLAYEPSQTGLFTYFLCAGLKGNADSNKDGRITLGELYTYVSEQVSATSKTLIGSQTPQFTGNPDFVLVEY